MDKIEELLTRGVEKIYPSKEELEKVLRSGKKLKLYQGFDPTGRELHIGHMIGLRKLAQFQRLGHTVIFLIGTGTGQAGDPSGKTTAKERFLSEEVLKRNAQDYVVQAKKILRFEGENAVEVKYNGDWLNELKLPQVLTTIGHFSLQQLLERDLFQDRIKRGESINLRAFIYPILQGYDSVALDVDLEIGGTDQTFNMLIGRDYVRFALHKEKFVLTTPLLADSEGKKIGKSEGNVIALNDNPEDMFGKIMALPDDIIVKGFEYLTDTPMKEIENIKRAIKTGANPVKYKKQLAFEIVKQLNDENEARKTHEEFEKTIQKHEVPKDIPVYQYTGSDKEYVNELLVQARLANSRSEAKRLVEQGGVTINESRITNHESRVNVKNGMIIRVGKRKFVRIKLNANS